MGCRFLHISRKNVLLEKHGCADFLMCHVRKAQACQQGADKEKLFPVADVSQSCNRGQVDLSGLWTTLCTSSRLMNMDDHRMLSGAGMMSMLGFDMAKKKVTGMSQAELMDLAGNSMAFTQLSRVLLPKVKHYIVQKCQQ